MVSRQEIFLGYPHDNRGVFHIWEEIKLNPSSALAESPLIIQSPLTPL